MRKNLHLDIRLLVCCVADVGSSFGVYSLSAKAGIYGVYFLHRKSCPMNFFEIFPSQLIQLLLIHVATSISERTEEPVFREPILVSGFMIWNV